MCIAFGAVFLVRDSQTNQEAAMKAEPDRCPAPLLKMEVEVLKTLTERRKKRLSVIAYQ